MKRIKPVTPFECLLLEVEAEFAADVDDDLVFVRIVARARFLVHLAAVIVQIVPFVGAGHDGEGIAVFCIVVPA